MRDRASNDLRAESNDTGGVLASTGVVVDFKEHVRDGYVTR